MKKRVFVIAVITIMAVTLVLGGCSTPAAEEDFVSPLTAGPSVFDDSRSRWTPTIDNDPDKVKYYNSFGEGLNPLLYPEYENDIYWYVLPKDFVGGYGTIVEVKNPKGGYVNVRSGPSLKYNPVYKLEPYDEDYWMMDVEMFVTDEGYHVGTYYIECDDYTWSPVYRWNEKTYRDERGWVALEVCSCWGM